MYLNQAFHPSDVGNLFFFRLFDRFREKCEMNSSSATTWRCCIHRTELSFHPSFHLNFLARSKLVGTTFASSYIPSSTAIYPY